MTKGSKRAAGIECEIHLGARVAGFFIIVLRDELPHKIYSKIPVEKYLVPVSGSTVTTTLP